MENVKVYTTALIFELDIVRDAFKAAHIPFFVQSESLGGVVTAFEASPASGFGRRWFMLVPDKYVSEVHLLLAGLPISFDSDTKPFPVIDVTKVNGYRWKLAVIIIPFLFLLVWQFIIFLNNK